MFLKDNDILKVLTPFPKTAFSKKELFEKVAVTTRQPLSAIYTDLEILLESMEYEGKVAKRTWNNSPVWIRLVEAT